MFLNNLWHFCFWLPTACSISLCTPLDIVSWMQVQFSWMLDVMKPWRVEESILSLRLIIIIILCLMFIYSLSFQKNTKYFINLTDCFKNSTHESLLMPVKFSHLWDWMSQLIKGLFRAHWSEWEYFHLFHWALDHALKVYITAQKVRPHPALIPACIHVDYDVDYAWE